MIFNYYMPPYLFLCLVPSCPTTRYSQDKVSCALDESISIPACDSRNRKGLSGGNCRDLRALHETRPSAHPIWKVREASRRFCGSPLRDAF